MKLVVSILGLVIAYFAARYVLREQFGRVIKTVTTDKAAECLVMLGSTTREEEKLTYIVGNIRNKCDQKFGHVTISFKLDRPSGPMSSLPEAVAVAYARDVQPGETRSFKSVSSISSKSTFRFDAISAY
jgi:hypothetical protein